MERTPIGPTPARADVLGQLKRERWHAANAKETVRVEQLDREIERLSAAGTATAPTRETAAAPRQHTAARTDKKENRRVPARRPA